MDHDLGFLADLDLAGEATTDPGHRERHASDAGSEEFGHLEVPGDGPEAVVYAESTGDVSTLLGACNERGVPVTPYAAGTGLEGAAIATQGGVSLDLTRLDEVREVRPADLQVDVEAGVMGGAVDEAVARHGLFFPPLPSSGEISTIGGMIATDASGMGTVKYGEVADWVLRVEAVLADGSVAEFGSRARKTSSGYNLKDLVVGSEGTLAVVTAATLRLAGRPEQILGGRAAFPTLDDATAAIADAVASGVDFAKVELLDAETIEVANAYSGTDLPVEPHVFVEFHADHGVEREAGFCETVFDAHDVARFETTLDEGEMADLWEARRDLTYALEAWDPERTQLHPGDVTVPMSGFSDLVRSAKDLAGEHDLFCPCFGHAGDGNVHFSVVADPDDPRETAAAAEVYEAIIRQALDLGGTVTGEHGIGLGKRQYLEREHGPAAVRAMRAVKDALDPEGTLNPGTVLPDADDGAEAGGHD